MKVTLNKTRVADAIRRCASVANAGKMGAISGKIRVVATLDSVEFAATDGARLLKIAPPDAIARVVEPGETLVPCRELLGVLSTSVDSDLTIERETERLVVSSGTATYRLQATDAPFPQPLKRQTLKTFELNGAELAVAAKVARSTVDCDRGRGYALAGAALDATANEVFLVGTDGQKLTAYRFGAPTNFSATDGAADVAVIPEATLRTVAKAFADAPTVRVEIADGGYSTFAAETTTLESVAVEGKFPNWRAIVPQKTGRPRVDFASETLAATVRAAACVADAKRPSVWFRLADGKLTAETTGAEIGASRITQAVEYRGEPFEVEFDSRFLLGFFGVLPSATTLTYWHGGDRIALFETSDEKISFVCLPLQPPQNKEKRR